MHPLSLKVMTWSWGLLGAETFVACVVYGRWFRRPFTLTSSSSRSSPAFAG